MELSKKDRLIIANQLKILAKLYPSESNEYENQRKAIESGYSLNYSGIFDSIYDEMSKEECQEVIDILNMYRAITFSFQKLKDKVDIDEYYLKFQGFDGNNETDQYSYVCYFVIDLNRFQELKYGLEYPDLNSHSPMLEKYRKMLEVWKESYNKNQLTKEDIIKIIGA